MSTSSEEDHDRASQKSEKKKKGEKPKQDKQDKTRKKEDPITLKKQADKAARQQQGDQHHPPREVKPQEKGVTETYMADESLGRRHQQHAEKKSEGHGDLTQRRDGFNNENQSPNTGSTPPRDVGSQSPPTSPLTSQMNIPPHSGTTQSWGLGAQGNVSPTTFAFPSLRQVWDDSLRYGTAPERGRGNPGNGPMLTNPPTSQPFSPHPGTGPLFDTAQGGHYGTQGQGNFPKTNLLPQFTKPTNKKSWSPREYTAYWRCSFQSSESTTSTLRTTKKPKTSKGPRSRESAKPPVMCTTIQQASKRSWWYHTYRQDDRERKFLTNCS